MSYLKISNRGPLPRECLEMVGLSSKRGRSKDAAVIGQFGSGTKYAAAAALRAGVHTGITSTDGRGSYYLMFATSDVRPEGYETHQRIEYRYFSPDGKDYLYPTDRVVEAFPDWDKPIGDDTMRLFKILREHLCNAYDEDKDFVWEFVDDHLYAAPGETRVYLGDQPEFRVMLERKPQRYFKFRSSHLPIYADDEIGEVWPKSEPNKTRLFLLGVLVSCSASSDHQSLFDYSLRDKRMLSEERILKNMHDYQSGVSRMFARLEKPVMIRQILRAAIKGSALFERSVLSGVSSWMMTTRSKAAWLAAVHDLYGDKVALPSGNPSVDHDVRQMYKYFVLDSLDSGLRTFFQALGIPRADKILPQSIAEEARRVCFEDLPLVERAKFGRAFRMFSVRFPDLAALPIVLFQPLTERMRNYHGFAGEGETRYAEMWIAVDDQLRFPSEDELYKTLCHESRHCATRAGDGERAFVNRADDDLAVISYREAGILRFPNGNRVPSLAPPRKPTFAPILEPVSPTAITVPVALVGPPVTDMTDSIDADLSDLEASDKQREDKP